MVIKHVLTVSECPKTRQLGHPCHMQSPPKPTGLRGGPILPYLGVLGILHDLGLRGDP